MTHNRLVGVLNHRHLAYLQSSGFQIGNLHYSKVPKGSGVVIVSDGISDRRLSLFSGITMATDLRLAGFRQPLVMLSFLNRQQLYKFDKYGILKDTEIYVWQLPLDKKAFNEFIGQVQKTPITVHSNINSGPIFQHRFPELFSTFMHGKSFDFISKITGPLRAACIIAQFYPEKEFLVWNMLEKANQHLSNEVSVQRLFFITGPGSLMKSGAGNQRLIDFVTLLRKLTGITPGEMNIQELIDLTDRLNKVFYQITEKHG